MSMVTETDVVMAYRLLLGREPESDAVVQGKLMRFHAMEELRHAFLTSEEFASNTGFRGEGEPRATRPLHWPRNRLAVDVGPDMLARLRERWLRMHRRDHGHEAAVDASEVGDLALAAERAGVDLARYRSCLEFSCGGTAFAKGLAGRFADRTVADATVALGAHREGPAFDVFVSMRALQQLPPPLMAHVLTSILERLDAGGLAYFQLLTYILDYRFDPECWLGQATPDATEGHCLPQHAVFEILARTGCSALEIREDGTAPAGVISNWLLVRKKEG